MKQLQFSVFDEYGNKVSYFGEKLFVTKINSSKKVEVPEVEQACLLHHNANTFLFLTGNKNVLKYYVFWQQSYNIATDYNRLRNHL